MIGGKYTKTLAKIQARRIFRIRDIRRNVLPKFIESCMKTPCWCPPGWAPTWRTETNRNICYRVLVQKREFIPRGTQQQVVLRSDCNTNSNFAEKRGPRKIKPWLLKPYFFNFCFLKISGTRNEQLVCLLLSWSDMWPSWLHARVAERC